jgi:peptidoglycan/LPS O-acetylase OafA/YrhL
MLNTIFYHQFISNSNESLQTVFFAFIFLLIVGISVWVVNTHKTEARTSKLQYLEGLRGWAAFFVVIHHCLCAFNHDFILNYTGPFYWLIGGRFEVTVFFVLSGLVLAMGPLKRQDPDVCLMGALKRYIRLMWPVFGSSLVYYVLLSQGWLFHHQAATLSGSVWLSEQYRFLPNAGAFVFGTLFKTLVLGYNQYSTVLWTMKFEFLGSFLVYACVWLTLQFKWPLSRVLMAAASLLLLLVVVLKQSVLVYSGFLLGIALWPLLKRTYISPLMSYGFVLLGLLLGCIPFTNPSFMASSPIIHTLQHALGLPLSATDDIATFLLTLGATILLAGIMQNPLLQQPFGAKFSAWLGKVSFGLYLLHSAVMLSIGCWSYVTLTPYLGGAVAATIASVMTVGISLLVADGFARSIDAASIILTNRFAKRVSDTFTPVVQPVAQA